MADLTRRAALLGAAALTAAAGPQSAWDFTFPSIEEGTLALADFRGKVLLVVNTASFCGYTYQYENLMKVHRGLGPKGLVVVGVPSQDFNQESADNKTVKSFCETNFDVDFPLAGLSHVRGAQAHPFYRWVKAQRGWEPTWNFNKILVARSGQVVACYGADEEPDGVVLSRAIGVALG
jgi:glutathione peroxidase